MADDMRHIRHRPEGQQVTPQQMAAIKALSDGATHAQAARQSGLTEAQLYAMRHSDAPFRAELEAAQARQWAQAASELRAGAGVAVASLVAIAGNLEAKDADRVRAACAILDRIGLPVTTEVTVSRGDELDLSGLTLEELQTWRALVDRARGVG